MLLTIQRNFCKQFSTQVICNDLIVTAKVQGGEKPFTHHLLQLIKFINNDTQFLFIAKIIDFRKPKISLLDICLDETGGTGVDCIIDNGGMFSCLGK